MLTHADRKAIETIVQQNKSLHHHMAGMLLREIERLEKALAETEQKRRNRNGSE